MAKLTPMTEQFQHFRDEVREDFWGDVYNKTKLAWKRYFETESQRQRDRYCGFGWYERGGRKKREYRNGYYERDFVTRFGTLRLRIARSRNKNFLPKGLERFQRRAEEVTLLIREAALMKIQRLGDRIVVGRWMGPDLLEFSNIGHCRRRRLQRPGGDDPLRNAHTEIPCPQGRATTCAGSSHSSRTRGPTT